MTDAAAINYEPLKQMSGATSRAFKASLKGWRLPAYVIAFVIGFLLTVKLGSLYPVIIVGIFLASHVGALANKYKSDAWLQFAMANGWQIDAQTSVFDLLPPSLNYGHSQKFSKVILSQLGPINADLFTYDCTTGSGKYEETHYFTVARVNLPESFPHIVLDSKSGHADIREPLKDKQQLKLEGDFGNYFRLFIEAGKEIDVLQLLTPDVMQTLVSANTREDVEINANNLYLILRDDKRDYKSMPVFVNSIIQLSQQIIQNSKLAQPPPAKTAVSSYT